MIEVAGAGGHRDFAGAPIANAAPICKASRIEHLAREGTTLLDARADPIYPANVASDRIQLATRAASEAGHLRGRSVQEQRAHGIRVEPINLPAVACSEDGQPVMIESHRV